MSTEFPVMGPIGGAETTSSAQPGLNAVSMLAQVPTTSASRLNFTVSVECELKDDFFKTFLSLDDEQKLCAKLLNMVLSLV